MIAVGRPDSWPTSTQSTPVTFIGRPSSRIRRCAATRIPARRLRLASSRSRAAASAMPDADREPADVVGHVLRRPDHLGHLRPGVRRREDMVADARAVLTGIEVVEPALRRVRHRHHPAHAPTVRPAQPRHSVPDGIRPGPARPGRAPVAVPLCSCPPPRAPAPRSRASPSGCRRWSRRDWTSSRRTPPPAPRPRRASSRRSRRSRPSRPPRTPRRCSGTPAASPASAATS